MSSGLNKKNQKIIKVRVYNKETSAIIDYNQYRIYADLLDELDLYIQRLYQTVYLESKKELIDKNQSLIAMYTRSTDNIFRKLLSSNYFNNHEFNQTYIGRIYVCIFYIIVKFSEDEVLTTSLLNKYTGVSKKYLLETEVKILKIIDYDPYKYLITENKPEHHKPEHHKPVDNTNQNTNIKKVSKTPEKSTKISQRVV